MIINKPKNSIPDFYDSVANRFRDPKIVYNRTEQVLELQRDYSKSDCCVKYNHKFVNLGFPQYSAPQNSIFIGFCGRTYKGLYHKTVWDKYYTNKLQESYYDYNVIDKDFQTKWYNKDFKFEFSAELFHTFQVPIMVIWCGNLILNANLKSFDFHKVLDAYSAFTDLQNFLSGILGSANSKIIEVADKYKIENHGYTKHSFRNPTRLKDLT